VALQDKKWRIIPEAIECKPGARCQKPSILKYSGYFGLLIQKVTVAFFLHTATGAIGEANQSAFFRAEFWG